MRVVRHVCAFLACLVMVVGCGGGGDSSGSGKPPTERKPVSVVVSGSQETAQGKTVIFDYSGPSFDVGELVVNIGDVEVGAIFSNDRIYVVLPLSQSGETIAYFEFLEGETASVQLNITEAPSIADPERYVSDQVAEVVSMFEPLQDEYPEVWEQLGQVQDQLADLSEDQARQVAIFFKQNLEPLLGDPETPVGEILVSKGFLEFAAVQISDGAKIPAVAQSFSDECRAAGINFVLNALVVRQAIVAAVLSTYIGTVVGTPVAGTIVAVASFAIIAVKIKTLGNAIGDILDACVFKEFRVLLDSISGEAVLQVPRSAFLFGGTSRATAFFQSSDFVSQGSDSGDRLAFTDGESKTVSVNLESRIQIADNERSRLLGAYRTFRGLLVDTNERLESLGLGLSFRRLINLFPTSLESSESADTSDFEIEVPSPYLNIEGEITARERGKLTLLFSFPLGPPVAEDHSDFVFVLTDRDGDPIRVLARLLAAEDVLPYDNLIDAVLAGDFEAVKALIDAGADLNIQDDDGDTPLHWAADGYTDIARALIDAGADLNIQDDDGWTPLHWVAGSGYTDIARALIDAGADLNIQDDDGWTPLHQVAFNGHADIARLLIDAGANLNIQVDSLVELFGETGYTPLDIAKISGHTDIVRMLESAGGVCNRTCEEVTLPYDNLLDAVIAGDLEAVNALIDAGANLNIQNSSGQTPLDVAVSLGHIDISKALITAGAEVNADHIFALIAAGATVSVEELNFVINAGVDVNSVDRAGRTFLHIAAKSGRIDIVKALIDAGADLNPRNTLLRTPLHTAIAFSEDNAIAIALIDAGADLNIRDALGGTPLILAIGRTDIAKALINAGADLNIKDNGGRTPLHRAAGDGVGDGRYPEIARALVDAGANLNIKNNGGRTPLNSAAGRGYTEIAKALINAGANLNIKDNGGWTPLNSALVGIVEIDALGSRIEYFGPHTPVILTLINAGANLNIKNNGGRTPLHRAAGRGYTEIAKALINAGADLNIQANNGRTSLDLAVIGFTETPGPHTSIVNALKARGAACNVTCEEEEE